jgi:hypothetical protein
MNEQSQPEHWHLSKGVPISVFVFMVVQTVGVIIWATRIDARVSFLESTNTVQDQRLAKLEDIYAKVAVIEDRQANTIRRLDVQADRMTLIIDTLNKLTPTKTYDK